MTDNTRWRAELVEFIHPPGAGHTFIFATSTKSTLSCRS